MNYFVLTLFSIWPFISFVSNNISKGIFIGEIINFYLGVLFALIIFYTVLKSVTKKDKKSLSIIIFIYIMFFMFFIFDEVMIDSLNIYRILVWWIVNLVGVFYIWKNPYEKSPHKLYSIILFIFYIVPLVNVLYYAYNLKPTNLELSTENTFPEIKGDKPNVYFFILDAYARSDILKKNFSHDSADFLSKLEKNRFSIVKNSFSNYPLTYLSVASTLSMDYLVSTNDIITSREPFIPLLRGSSEVPKYFKSQGYQYIHAHSHVWAGSACDDLGVIDKCLPEKKESLYDVIFYNESIENILKLTQVPSAIKFLYDSLPNIDEDLSNIGFFSEGRLQHLEQINTKVDSFLENEPFFLFAHVFTPHEPNTYGENCEKVSDLTYDAAQYKTDFIKQVKCSEADVLELIDTIIRLDKSNPIIVLQGDHGSESRNQWSKGIDDWNEEDILERFAILNAVRLPNQCDNLLYNNMTSVNTFRVIISCLANENVKLLPDISFLTLYEGSPDYGLIKEKIRDGIIVR